MSELYYKDGDRIAGPVSADELEYLKSIGRINGATQIRKGSTGNWKPLNTNHRRTTTTREKQSVPVQPAPGDTGISSTIETDASVSPAIPTAKPSLEVKSPNVRRQLVAGTLMALVVLMLLMLFGRRFQFGIDGGSGNGVAGTDSAAQAQKTEGDQSGSRPSDKVTPQTTEDVHTTDDSESEDSPPAVAVDTAAPEPDRQQNGIEVLPGDPMSKFTIAATGEATFFGISATGHRFAFVVDRSGSMSGAPMTRAKSELLKCIDSLPDDVEVIVVFFDSTAYADPDGPRVLSDASRRSLAAWVESVPAAGGTQPEVGMRHALQDSLHPDVTFLLTDGQFDAAVPNIIHKMNSTIQSQINTIAFMSRDGEPLLKQIARQNNGDYRFVP